MLERDAFACTKGVPCCENERGMFYIASPNTPYIAAPLRKSWDLA